MISLLGIALARILFILAAINLTNMLVFDRLEPSFDLSLLDQIPQTRAVIDILTVLIAVFILLGMFSKSTKKKLDDDKKNFTHLSSIHEAKRSLTRVQFHETDKGKRDAGLWMGIQIMENLTAALLWMQSGRKNARPSFPGFLMNLWNSALGQDNAGGFFIRKGDAAFR